MDFFDLLAPIYDSVFSNKEDLCNLIDFPNGGFVLDIGGGTGRISGTQISGCRIFVVDRSRSMLKQTKNKVGLIPICANAEALPFKSLAFQRILVIDAFHHFQNHPLTLDEIMRVLSEKGKAFIKEPDIKRILVKFVALIEKLLQMKSVFFSTDEFRKMIGKLKCEYSIIETKYYYCAIVEKTA